MVSMAKSFSLIFIMAILVVMAFKEASAGCSNVQECLNGKGRSSSKVIKSRKVLAMLKDAGGLHGPVNAGDGEKVVRAELRTAPAGPDPLHHHGGTSKKPRSDP